MDLKISTLNIEDIANKFQANETEQGPLPPVHFKIQNSGGRQKYLQRWWAFWWAIAVSTLYLLSVSFVIYLVLYTDGKLSDNVLIALLTSTTATVIGLPALMIKSLFQQEKEESQTNKSN